VESRWIDFAGCANARDLGGYRTEVPTELIREAGADGIGARTRPATMRRFLAGFRDRWPSVETFAAGGGASADVIAAVRENLVSR
jgi:hypothetical protein